MHTIHPTEPRRLFLGWPTSVQSSYSRSFEASRCLKTGNPVILRGNTGVSPDLSLVIVRTPFHLRSKKRVRMGELESQLSAKFSPISQLPAKVLTISQLTVKKHINNSQLSVKKKTHRFSANSIYHSSYNNYCLLLLILRLSLRIN